MLQRFRTVGTPFSVKNTLGDLVFFSWSLFSKSFCLCLCFCFLPWSKTHKRLRRTLFKWARPNARICEEVLFSDATYNNKIKNQFTYLSPVRCYNGSEGKGHETDVMKSFLFCSVVIETCNCLQRAIDFAFFIRGRHDKGATNKCNKKQKKVWRCRRLCSLYSDLLVSSRISSSRRPRS